jgi:hypothetical protein
MLAFKHNAGGFGTLGTLALEAETSGGSNITAHRYKAFVLGLFGLFRQSLYEVMRIGPSKMRGASLGGIL